jgi:hypothetical protein
MEENRIPKRVLCMNLESTRTRGKPKYTHRWQGEVEEDGRVAGKSIYNREEWKKLVRTARNCRILQHGNGMNERMNISF